MKVSKTKIFLIMLIVLISLQGTLMDAISDNTSSETNTETVACTKEIEELQKQVNELEKELEEIKKERDTYKGLYENTTLEVKWIEFIKLTQKVNNISNMIDDYNNKSKINIIVLSLNIVIIVVNLVIILVYGKEVRRVKQTLHIESHADKS